MYRGAAKKEDTINPGFPSPLIHSSVQPLCLFVPGAMLQSKQGNDETDRILFQEVYNPRGTGVP